MTTDSFSVPSPVADDGDTLDLNQLFAILWSGRWTILVAVFVSLFFAGLYLVAASPVYEADGTVQVEQNSKGASSDLGTMASLFGAPMETEAEIQIIQSRMVLSKVIETLKLEISAQPKYFPIIGSYIARKRGEGGDLAPPLFENSSFAWGGERIEVSQFDVPDELLATSFQLIHTGNGNFRLLNAQGIEVLKGTVGTLATGNGAFGAVQLFVKDLQGHEGVQFNIMRRTFVDTLSDLSGKLKVSEAGKQSGIIDISVEGPKPRYVANVIQQIEDAYVRQNVERRSAEAEQSLEFLRKQLPEIKSQVDVAQARLNSYQLKQGSVNVTKETEIVLEQAVDFETKRLELINQRQQAIQRFTPQHPSVQTIDAQLKSLEAEQNTIKKRTEALPETQQEILSLMRDLEVNTQIYTMVLNSAQELQVAKAGTTGNVRIIDYPLVPIDKSKPKAILAIAGAILFGLIAGITYLLLQKALFRGVDRPEQIESSLGLPTYAAIPYTPIQQKIARAALAESDRPNLLVELEPDNVAIEALRSLRTALQFALLEAPNNIIMFTGPTPGLGKSFISVNLGGVLSKSGKKVAVVDCDLRRGQLHRYFGASASPGLSDYIAGNADLKSIQRKTSVENLTVITNGVHPPNPAELLLNDRFAHLLESLSKEYDLVIVDTPPILPVTDASIIGRLVGCVLMVLKEGEHPMRMIEESARRLRQAGVNIKGTIFNQVGRMGTGYGYYSTYYKYVYGEKYGR